MEGPKSLARAMDEFVESVAGDCGRNGNYEVLCSDAQYRSKYKQETGEWLRLCRSCLEYLPFGRFYRKRRSSSGKAYLSSKCKTCSAIERRDRERTKVMRRRYERLLATLESGDLRDRSELQALHAVLHPGQEMTI